MRKVLLVLEDHNHKKLVGAKLLLGMNSLDETLNVLLNKLDLNEIKKQTKGGKK